MQPFQIILTVRGQLNAIMVGELVAQQVDQFRGFEVQVALVLLAILPVYYSRGSLFGGARQRQDRGGADADVGGHFAILIDD